jgi:arylsulfatase A
MTMLTCALVASTFLSAPVEEARDPNVILIMADDLGLAELGCTGGTRIRTPHIDALREEGMLFTNAYSGSTVCAPSRCTLLTGLHTGHAQVRDNGETPNFTGRPDDPETETIGGWKVPPEPNGFWGGQMSLEPGTETIGTALKRAGYATCGLGKWGLGGPDSVGHPNRQGFDHWFGYLCQRNAHNYYPTYLMRNNERVTLEGNERGLVGKQYATDLMVDEACDFIRSHADEPFLLYYATPVPHLALQVPDDSLAEYSGLWDDPPYVGGNGYLPHPEPRAAYAAMVTRFDRDIGRVVSLLDELGLREDTIIIVTSDNGSTFDLGGYDPDFFDGTGGLRGAKTWLHEGGIRVPLIVDWPGHVAAGSSSDELVANWDLFPTIMGLTGNRLEDSAETDGIDLTPVLLGTGEAPERDALYWEFHSRGGLQAMRWGRWKALRSGAHADADAPIELFDLEVDPAEANDVAAGNPDVVARMDRMMKASRTTSPVQRWNFGPEARGVAPAPDADAPRTSRRWTGRGDGMSFADPANWTGDGEIKAGGLQDLFIIDNGAAVVGGRSGCATLTCNGGELEVRLGRVTGDNRGFRNGALRIIGGSVDRQFLLGAEVTLGGTGVLRLHGGAEPLNRSRVDLVGPGARLEFTAETPKDVRDEHLRKLTVDGEKAVIGENIVIEPVDEGGSVVRVKAGGAS